MYLYIELWKSRPKWSELSQDERKSWMDDLVAGFPELFESGVEPIGLAFNDADTSHSSGYDYLAVWKMPNKEVALQFENHVENLGFHDFFEQVNTRGKVAEMEEIVAAMANG